MTLFSYISPLVPREESVPVAVRDGIVHLRPVRPGDTATIELVFAGMSAESRASRYMVPVPHLPASMRRALTAVDGCRHVAWTAVVDGSPVGIARYVRSSPRTAEIAFEVVDAHQGRGIGAALLDAVTTVAALNGVRRIQASVLPDNHSSLRLLAELGLLMRPEGGILEGESALTLMPRPRVDRPAVAAVAMRHRPGARDADRELALTG